MKKHPTKQQLIDLALGISASDASMREHLDRCDACAGLYGRYISALKQSENSSLAPSPGLENRIRFSVRAAISGKQVRQPVLMRPAAALTGLGLAAMIAAALIWFISPVKKEIPLALRTFKAVDHAHSAPHMQTREGSWVNTGKDSCAEISLDDDISIVLSPESSLKITRSETGQDKKTVDASFYLKKGELLARFGHGSRTVRYSFETPVSRIDSMGTEFLLRALPGAAEVAMIEGKVLISPDTGETAVAVAGNTYRAAAGITRSLSSQADLERAEELRDLRESNSNAAGEPEQAERINEKMQKKRPAGQTDGFTPAQTTAEKKIPRVNDTQESISQKQEKLKELRNETIERKREQEKLRKKMLHERARR